MISIQDLPENILLLIFYFFDIREILRLRSASRHFYPLKLPFILSFASFKKSIKFVRQNTLIHKLFLLDENQIDSVRFIYLAKIGHVQFCKILPNTSFDPIVYQQAFHAAHKQALGHQSKIIWSLISGNYSVDPSIQSGMILEYAAKAGNPDLVEWLLHDVRFKPLDHSSSALRLAARWGRPSCLKALMIHSDVTAMDQEAIREASANGHVKCVKLLLMDPNILPHAQDNEALIRAASRGHLLVVLLLLQDKRVDYRAQNYAALYQAYAKGKIEVVRHLFELALSDPTQGQNFCIRFASRIGDSITVSTLLKNRAIDPSVKNNYALRIACRYAHKEIIKILLADERVDPRANRNEALTSAREQCHRSVVNLLLKDDRVLKEDAFQRYLCPV
jgi:ankyrin repeat protein